MNNSASSQPRTIKAPDFKQVRRYLRTDRQREALGLFVKAGWTAEELGEFARQIYLAPSKNYPTVASYQHAMEKGADHPYALETLATLRKRGFTMPAFSRPVPKVFAWDDPENPEHSSELRADIEEMARLWRKREACCRGQPCPNAAQSIPRSLWSKLFKIRNRYHSLADTIECEGLGEEMVAEVLTIARCLQNRGAYLFLLPRPDPNKPIPPRLWKTSFDIRCSYNSLQEALEHRRLANYR